MSESDAERQEKDAPANRGDLGLPEPCPLCGHIHPRVSKEAHPTKNWVVMCTWCLAMGPPCAQREMAIERWNRRACPECAGETLTCPIDESDCGPDCTFRNGCSVKSYDDMKRELAAAEKRVAELRKVRDAYAANLMASEQNHSKIAQECEAKEAVNAELREALTIMCEYPGIEKYVGSHIWDRVQAVLGAATAKKDKNG